MPYKTILDLPKKIREHLALPEQEVYLEAFNQAWREYRTLEDKKVSRKETATKMAWNAVRNRYIKIFRNKI